MFLRLQLLVFIVAIQGVSSLKCYGYVPGANNTLVLGIVDSSNTSGICSSVSCACASYMFQCSMNDTECSTQQQQNQAIIWNYILTDNTTCQALLQDSSCMNTICCYTDLCNNQGMSATSTTVIGMMSTLSPNSTTFLSFSTWIVLLALIFCS